MSPHIRQAPRGCAALSRYRAWLIIAFFCGAFFIPYCLPGAKPDAMGAYPALSIIPIIIAALLRARKGSLVANIVLLSGLAVCNSVLEGLPWSKETFSSWLVGGSSMFIIGITIGQFMHLRKQLMLKNEQLLDTHLELQASHEALNHRALMETLERDLAHARRHQRPYTVILCDIDHFKALNDSYGHPVGDAILQEFTHVVRELLRAEDNIGRWGGEEFILLLPDTHLVGAETVAERLRATIASHSFQTGGGIHLTCSVGVAVFPDHAHERAPLLDAADKAMYAAKHLGRNQVRMAHDTAVQEMTVQREAGDSRDEQALMGTVKALADMLAARDRYTGEHTSSVGTLAMQIALALGLGAAEARMIEVAGQLHDIGKVAIPDAILRKAGKLAEDEWVLMRQHPCIGAEIASNVPALRGCVATIRAHHERWDGTGYPDGLAGEAIPLGARIIAVVDSFDAIITDRPYRPARDAAWALDELRRCAGSQFDPLVVETLARILETSDEGVQRRAA
jgi:diguanylate cyclase (GGDEF)-like protein/putative nucleotidyltransferase with HDIG domain